MTRSPCPPANSREPNHVGSHRIIRTLCHVRKTSDTNAQDLMSRRRPRRCGRKAPARGEAERTAEQKRVGMHVRAEGDPPERTRQSQQDHPLDHRGGTSQTNDADHRDATHRQAEEKDQRDRPDQIELLFDRERPAVADHGRLVDPPVNERPVIESRRVPPAPRDCAAPGGTRGR